MADMDAIMEIANRHGLVVSRMRRKRMVPNTRAPRRIDGRSWLFSAFIPAKI